ncbi:flagellar biosynthetic protein FliO [Bacillus sp. FJAT-45066]|uniref:flagellar biosynthetic protein FliO n=1 Tax=Bacillus sp. FJAT-45066 TaxID=2011010 RepID=UPI000BB8D6AB|nr:flagellar biosynthetic protein FliO [Bacillus sp. FJAT-45066]
MYVNISRLFIVLFLLITFSPTDISAGGGVPNNAKECMESPQLCNDNEQSVPNFSERENAISGWDFIKMFLALGFVLFLIYGAMKLVNKKNQLFDTQKTILNVGGTTLGNNKSLQIVKVGNSILVLGVSDSIQLLKEVSDEEEKEVILKAYQDRIESSINSEQIIGLIGKWKEKKAVKSSNTFSSLLKDQLNNLSNERKNKLERIKKEEL